MNTGRSFEADGRRLADFFRYHGAWAPGVRLFRAISFQAKAAVITGVFLVPIVFLAWQYFGDKAAAIEFSERERVGVRYLRQTTPVLQALVARRVAVAASDSTALASSQASVRQAWDALTAVQAEIGTVLGTQASFDAARTAILAETPASATPGDRMQAEHRAIDALLALVGVANDGSNLTLDPDLDTYYLMDGAIFALPGLMDQSGRLAALALAGGAEDAASVRALTSVQVRADLDDGRLGVALEKVDSVHQGFSAQRGVGDTRQAFRQYLARVAPGTDPSALQASGREMQSTLVQAQAKMIDRLDELLAERVGRLALARNMTAIVLALALGVAIYLFLSFRKVLDGGLREVAFHIESMRDGDLTTTPRAWGADEMASLMLTLSQMQASLRGIVQQVREASDGIVTAAGQITAGSMDLSSRTENAAASLQQSAAAMEQISSTTQSTAVATRDASALAADNARSAESGGQVIVEVVQTMEGIRLSSGRIVEIIGTIDGIAFQTNILALNAAVEAARAGEAGRGFAVVASEVRALSQRSSQAAREIKQLISSSVEQVEAGGRIVESAGRTMRELVANAGRINHLLSAVATGIDEQARGVAQTTTAVHDLDRNTQQNAALVEESAAAAASLEEQARALAQRVSRFRLAAAD